MEADPTAIRHFGSLAAELACTARATAATVAGVQPAYGPAAAQFLDALQAAVAAHAQDVIALGDILERAATAAAVTATAYTDSDAAASHLIGT